MSDEVKTSEPEVQERIKPQATRLYKNEEKKKIKVLTLAAQGVSTNQIAERVGVSFSTVKRIIKQFTPIFKQLERVNDYRTVKADLLAAGQLAALESAMSPSKLEKASFISTLSGFEILNKAERLENNQSTNNVSLKIGMSGLTDE